MRAALAATLLAAGCTQSGTGVLLLVDGNVVIDQLSIRATFGGRTLERAAPQMPAGPLHLPLSLIASLPDADTTVSLAVTGRFGGLDVAAATVGPLAIAANHVERASVTLDGSGFDLAGIDFPAADFAADFSAVDARPPADLAPSYAPSHLDVSYWSGTATVTINNNIDTDLLQIDGAPPPAGASFTLVGMIAVLQVGTLVIAGPPGNTVRVTGTPALIITATQNIQIDGILDGSGHRDGKDGPGAYGPRTGGNGMWSTATTTGAGGGGGGYYVPGGNGGNSADAAVPGAIGGSSFNNPNVTALKGGAPGGGGAAPTGGACAIVAQPGGGGGALQLSALGSLTITNVMAGITVGGAGGRGGAAGCPGNSGAGGGSGGAILLESPAVTVLNGALRATGGGGGGAGAGAGPGDNAPFNGDCAAGGAAGGGPGGCTANPNPGFGANSMAAGTTGGGGGGGAAGYIHIRTHGAPTLSSAISPPATVSNSL